MPDRPRPERPTRDRAQLDRRGFLLASTTVGAAAMTAGLTQPAQAHPAPTARFDRPEHGFAPASTTLYPGQAGALGLDQTRIDHALATIHDYAEPTEGTPLFPGAVTLLAQRGVVFARQATGWALRYGDRQGTELPPSRRTVMRPDTIFDLASLSKLFTTLVALQLLEEGRIALDVPVATYLPGYGVHGKATITPRMLLTHTAGLPADPKPPLWQGYATIPERKHAILTAPIQSTPGAEYRYSDLSMLSMQLLIEHVTGNSLDREVHARIAAPLGLNDTGYNPTPSLRTRIAPTEYEVGDGGPNRGLVWGQVHDENAWALGGVAGHAGVFSTADDLATLAQAILNGGTYRGTRILEEHTTELIFANFNQRFPGEGHGLGFELDQMFYMGALASQQTAGHTGFTGTSLVIDRLSRTVAILLTNRVHPNRNRGSINPARETVATAVARAMPVPARVGHHYWASQLGNASTATLTTDELPTGGRQATLSFDAFVDTESTDQLTVDTSTDGGRTWTPCVLTATGPGAPATAAPALSGHGHRRWWRVRTQLPAAARTRLRWRYVTDPSYTGRGVGIADAIVRVGDRTVFDLERDEGSVHAHGWARTVD